MGCLIVSKRYNLASLSKRCYIDSLATGKRISPAFTFHGEAFSMATFRLFLITAAFAFYSEAFPMLSVQIQRSKSALLKREQTPFTVKWAGRSSIHTLKMKQTPSMSQQTSISSDGCKPFISPSFF
jgi:hypothetical protein